MSTLQDSLAKLNPFKSGAAAKAAGQIKEKQDRTKSAIDNDGDIPNQVGANIPNQVGAKIKNRGTP